MHFWNDYEGQTVAQYPLERLLRPEGRSAFFVTPNGTGEPSVIRLTESLNDEQEMLERWRQVSEVHQENLVAIKTYGQTTFDGVPLAYALMEPTDGNLGEILAERPLTVVETMEVGRSVVAAVTALHAMGLVHEHIEPGNVLAAGEVIKLRSDCVRECVEDGEFVSAAACAELRQKDVNDVAALLLRCLTLDTKLGAGVRLGAPFDRIVAKGMDGSWGLTEMGDALAPASVPVVRPLVPEGVVRAAAEGSQGRAVTGGPRVSSVPVQAALPFAGDGPALPVRRVVAERVEEKAGIARVWLMGAAAVVVGLLVWFFVPGKTAGTTVAANKISTIDDAPAGKGAASVPIAGKAAVAAGKDRGVAAASTGAGWRVVGYTFTHPDQAWIRVGAIRKAHPGLNPQVFQPAPGGPYYLTLGGAMSQGEAEAMVRRARGDGLPRDTFARFYRGR